MIRRTKLRGYTLVEMLVTVTIIGLAVAIVIPAVQASREASRRAQCINNLKQFGLGVAATVAATNRMPRDIVGVDLSLHAALLQYLDQAALYNALNFALLGEGPGNSTIATSGIATFLCPSESAPWMTPAWTSYAGNRGSGVQRYGYNGAFVNADAGAQPLTLGEFLDGSSATACMSEWLAGPLDPQARDPKRSSYASDQRYPLAAQLDQFSDACQSLDWTAADLSVAVKGSEWVIGEFYHTMYNHSSPINGRSCTNGTGVQIGTWAAGSGHPGGVNVLFVDGHVQFLRDGISLAVWRALGSRNGKEIIEEGVF